MKKVTLKYTINLVDLITATSLRVHTSEISKHQLEASRTAANRNVMEEEFDVTYASNNVSIYLTIVGDPFKSGSFNLTKDGQKVFKEDVTFTTKQNGRVTVTKHNIKLPA